MARRCWSSALSSDMKGRSIELLKVKNLSLYRSPICQVHEEPAKLEALLQQGQSGRGCSLWGAGTGRRPILLSPTMRPNKNEEKDYKNH
jgi:hypothetical protein